MLHYIRFYVGFYFLSTLSSHQQHVLPSKERDVYDTVKLNPVGQWVFYIGVSRCSPLGFVLDHTK